MKRWLPKSLFMRLVLVLVAGLVLAQAAGLAIYWRDRDEFMQHAFGMRSVQRIADIIRVLDPMSPAERNQIVGVLNSPQLRIALDLPPLTTDDVYEEPTGLFIAALRRALGEDRPLLVKIARAPFIKGPPPGYGPGMMKGGMMGAGGGFGPGAGFGPGGGIGAGAVSFVVQAPLRDGTLVTLDSRQQRDTTMWSYRLLASLGILLVAIVAIALTAVRWVTRPLNTLAEAAEQLGENIDRPPLDENGPVEVSRAARAFNTMQLRISKLIEERARVFGAMSHDLKTPITRLRLRAELLDEPGLRSKFEHDLVEMEQMVAGALDLVRGMEKQEALQPVDIAALLKAIAEDSKLTGGRVEVSSGAVAPYPGRPHALKRCFANLIENAVKYGGSAVVSLSDHGDRLQIRIRDRGPGIPEAELDKVFDPFYRLERSRSRETGGTGLGLSIARNVVRAHGGDLVLQNVPDGGLEAVVSLPRSPSALRQPE
jgi:signal transduction histidine kinase